MSPHRAVADASAGLELSSAYVDRGLRLADFTFHPSIEMSSGDFYGGIWTALPVENREAAETTGDQYDFYSGYGWAISDRTAIDVGGTLSFVDGYDEAFEAYAGLVAELGTFSPSIYIYKDFELKAWTLEAATRVAIPLEGFPVEATVRVGLVEGHVDYWYYGADLVYPIELSDLTRLSLGLHYSDNDFGAGVPDNTVYGSASFRFSF